MVQDDFDAIFGDDDVEDEMEANHPVDQGEGTTAGKSSTYVEPAAQAALNQQFSKFFLVAYKQGEPRILEQHEQIGYAVNKANYLHFREGYYTWVFAGTELTWQGKDVGYQVKPDDSH